MNTIKRTFLLACFTASTLIQAASYNPLVQEAQPVCTTLEECKGCLERIRDQAGSKVKGVGTYGNSAYSSLQVWIGSVITRLTPEAIVALERQGQEARLRTRLNAYIVNAEAIMKKLEGSKSLLGGWRTPGKEEKIQEKLGALFHEGNAIATFIEQITRHEEDRQATERELQAQLTALQTKVEQRLNLEVREIQALGRLLQHQLLREAQRRLIRELQRIIEEEYIESALLGGNAGLYIHSPTGGSTTE